MHSSPDRCASTDRSPAAVMIRTSPWARLRRPLSLPLIIAAAALAAFPLVIVLSTSAPAFVTGQLKFAVVDMQRCLLAPSYPDNWLRFPPAGEPDATVTSDVR